MGERIGDAAPGTSPDEADRLVDHRSRRQSGLQLDGKRQRVGEDLRVVHSDRRRFGEQFAELGRVLIEDIFAVGIYVDRPDHLIWQQQWQRACSDVRDLSSPAVNSVIAGTCAHHPAGARRALRPPATYSLRSRREMAPTL
jgi:hypothetical protein